MKTGVAVGTIKSYKQKDLRANDLPLQSFQEGDAVIILKALGFYSPKPRQSRGDRGSLRLDGFPQKPEDYTNHKQL